MTILATTPARSQLRVLFHRNWHLGIGAALLAAIVLLGIAVRLAGIDPDAQDLTAILSSPTSVHPLGTDQVGRDQLSRVAYGAVSTLTVAVGAIVMGGGLGTILGVASAHYGGWIGSALTMLADTLLALPAMVLALAIAAAFGPGLTNLTFAIAIVYLPQFLRLARSQALGVTKLSYIESARIAGAGDFYIMSRYILPNIMLPLVAYAFLSLSSAALAEAALSFLGVGIQPPTASLGYMIKSGGEYIVFSPALVIVPGTMIFLIAIAFNLIGEGLQRRLHLQLSERA